MRCLKLIIAYDGTAYAGWQRQPGEPTVQEALETAWEEITGESARLMGSSRTDAGVHALGQVASISTNSELELEVLCGGLNARLDSDIVVLQVEDVPLDFNAIDDTVSKRYRYQIHNSRVRTVFDRDTTWHVPYRLDAAAMQDAARTLVGRHDFTSFQSAGSPRESTVRTICELTVAQGQGGRIQIEVEGDGFLYNMVRAIVGTLVEVGRGARAESWIAEVLAARDRSQAGPTAPPRGLFLVKVDYETC